MANEWNRGLKESFERFPKLKENIKWVGEAYDRNEKLKPVVYDMNLRNLVKNNPKFTVEKLKPYAEKYTTKFMRGMAIGERNWAQSCSTTEFPELLKFRGVTFNKKTGKDASKLLESLKRNVDNKYHPIGCDTIKSILDHEIGHQLDDLLGIRKIQEIRDLRSVPLKDLTEKLSSYTWDNSSSDRYAEMIAEGWAEYLNNPNPREYAKKIGEVIEREYKKQFGGN